MANSVPVTRGQAGEKSPRSTRKLAHPMQHIHKSWSAFPTATASRYRANCWPGKGATRVGECIILRGNYAADAAFSQIESIMGTNGRQTYPYAEPDIGI